MAVFEPRDYSNDIQYLEKLINQVQTNVYFVVGTLVAILALAIALVSWAVTIVVKNRVEKTINKEIDSIEKKIKSFSADNPQILWNRGVGNLISSSFDEDKNQTTHIYYVIGLKNFKKENLIYLDVYYVLDNIKVPIDDFNIYLKDDGIEVKVIENFNRVGSNLRIHAFVMWSNPYFSV